SIILEEDVGSLRQFLKYRSSLCVLNIDRETALVSIEPNIARRETVNHRVPAANNVADAGPLDFNYFRAHIGEEARGKRAGKHLLKGQDLDAIQRAAGFRISCHSHLISLKTTGTIGTERQFQTFQWFQPFQPCSLRFIFDGGKQILLRGVSFLPDHYAARIVDHNFAVLLNAPGANLDDAPLRLRFGLSLLQDFGCRVKGIAGKKRIGQFYLVPTEGKTVFAHIGDTQTGHNREGQRAVNQTLAELRALAILIIKMNLIRVIRQQGEPDVVRLRDGPPKTAAINVADFKVFEEAPFPAGFDSHTLPFLLCGLYAIY